MRIVKQNRFKNLGELHKEWTEAGVKASRATTQTCQGIWLQVSSEAKEPLVTWAKEKNWTVAQWFKVLFQMRASFVFHLETKVLESGGRVEKFIAQVAWSPVLNVHSLWWFGVQCHLLVLVHCVFLKTTSLHPFTNKFWSTSCFLLLTSFLKMLISFFSRIWHLPHCQSTKSWLNYHGVGVLDWPGKHTRPDPHRESMGYCQEENEKQKTKNAVELKATVK